MPDILSGEYLPLYKSRPIHLAICLNAEKWNRILFLTILFLFCIPTGNAANYYVSNSGKDLSAGTTPQTAWKTLTKISGRAFSAGDSILLKRGDVWRERLIVSSSGASGKPIVFAAYGTGENPVIDGADVITGMTNYTTNVWQKTGITIQPNLMYLNGIVGRPQPNLGACTSEGDWYWDNDTKVLSIYSTIGDPSGNVELGQRKRIADLVNRKFITLKNLTIQHSNERNILGAEDWDGALHSTWGSHLTISECTIQKNGFFGIQALNASHLTFDSNTFLRNGEGHKNGMNVRIHSITTGISNITFTNNQCNYSGGNGLFIHTLGKVNYITNVDIHGNHFDNNGAAGLYVQQLDSVVIYANYFDRNGIPDPVDDDEDYGIGVTSCDNIDIYQNTITNQVYNDAIQIYSDAGPYWGSSNNVRIFRNYIFATLDHGDGIGIGSLDDRTSENMQIFNNVIVGSSESGINLFHDRIGSASSVSIFNNTFYENVGAGVRAANATGDFPFELKNNIFSNNGRVAEVRASNSSTSLTSSNNLWFRSSGNVLSYNSKTYTTETIKGFESSAQTSDPFFTDAAHGDFRLKAGSPAINAGANVGITKDILGNPIVGFTDIGAFEYQPSVKTSTEYKTICDGNNYNGWKLTGKYERTLLAKSGVDSVVTTYLTVNPKYAVQEEVTILSGEIYNGWSASGTYTRTLSSISGCDSTITTHLTVNINTVKLGELTQILLLKKGANMISTYLQANNPDVSAITRAIRDNGNLIKMQNESGNSYENWGAFGGWINNLGPIQNTEGYKMTVANDCSIQITGAQIALPLAIPLKTGWNIISYPRTDLIEAKNIIQALIDQNLLVKVQDELGNSIENWGIFGGWINGIGNFVPGKAYRVKVSASAFLTIHESYPKSAVIPVHVENTRHFVKQIMGNGVDHMNINLVDLRESGISIGDELAVFDGELCVGTVKISDFDFTNNTTSIPASASESNESLGFTEGNSIQLRVWKKDINEEYILSPELIEGELVFNKQTSVFVHLTDQKTTGINNFNSIDLKMYPNPANEKVTLTFAQKPEIGTQITLTDLTGKQLLIRQVWSINEVLDIQCFSAGLYFLKVTSGENYTVSKLIIN